MSEHLALKWGTLNGYDVEGNDAAFECIKRYHEEPTAWGAAQQRDTDTQRQALLDLIDAMNGPIYNDWSGEEMTKDQAKKYITEYRQ